MAFKDKEIGGRKASDSGSVLLDLAITMLPFILVVMGIIEFVVVGFTQLSLQYAVTNAARYASLGLEIPGRTRLESIEQTFADSAATFGLNSDDVNLRICIADSPDCNSDNPGGSGQFITISAEKPRFLFFTPAQYTITSRAIVKNERF